MDAVVPVRVTRKVFDETWISRARDAVFLRGIVNIRWCAQRIGDLAMSRETRCRGDEGSSRGSLPGDAPTRCGIVDRSCRTRRGRDIEPTGRRGWRRGGSCTPTPLPRRDGISRIGAYLTSDLTRSVDAPTRPRIPDLPWRTRRRCDRGGVSACGGSFEDRSSDGSRPQDANSRPWIPHVCRAAPVGPVGDDTTSRWHSRRLYTIGKKNVGVSNTLRDFEMKRLN